MLTKNQLHIHIGIPVTGEQLEEVAQVSGVMDVEDDFLSPNFRAECERIIPYPKEVEPNECKEAFIYLKENFSL
jgi:hypothetical protein